MNRTIHLKNMVCDRCKSTVMRELDALGIHIESVELGRVVVNDETVQENSQLEESLMKQGFEIIKEKSAQLTEEIKIALIGKIENQANENLSSFLTKRFKRSYSALSKLFSKSEGITIEKYEINLKIEKVKELIQLGQLNFSEIAYSLGYNNSSHLARQFHSVTGMSMTAFRNLQKWDRKAYDQIV